MCAEVHDRLGLVVCVLLGSFLGMSTALIIYVAFLSSSRIGLNFSESVMGITFPGLFFEVFDMLVCPTIISSVDVILSNYC